MQENFATLPGSHPPNHDFLHWASASPCPKFDPMPDTPAADPRFNEFVLLQAQNAGLFLGRIPDPRTGQPKVNLRAAKSVLEALEMLETKSRGNLTETETHLLATTLKNIRPLYQKALVDSQKSDLP